MTIALDASTPAAVWQDVGGTSSISTASFTPPSGSIIVAKVTGADAALTFGTPTGSGLTFTSQINVGTAGSNTRAAIFTAVGAGSATTVTASFAGSGDNRGLVVEVFTGAQLAGTPATDSLIMGSSGTASDTITTTGTNSVVTWVAADFNANDGASRTYQSSATETSYHRSAGYTGYQAYQAAASPGSQTYGISSPATLKATMAALEIQDSGGGGGGSPIDLTFVGSSAWVAPASSAAVAPTYPSSLQEGDEVYAYLVIKPDTATVATPTNWALVGSQAVGGGTQGAGAGACKVHVYKRVVPSGGLAGTESFTITGGSSPVAFMDAWRPQSGATSVMFAETLTFYSRTTASTTFGGTGGSNLSLTAKDVLRYISVSADDQSSTHTISALAATGATVGTTVQDPAATITNAQGNDISAAAAYAPVTAGPSSAAPSVTVSGSSSETGGGVFVKIDATGVTSTPIVGSDSDALADSSSLVVASSATHSATLTEGTSALAVTSSATHSATLTDSSSVVVSISSTESATLSESSSASATTDTVGSDSTTLTEASTLSYSAGGSDSASLADSSALAVTITGTGSATLSDSSSVSAATTVAGTDSTTLTESGTSILIDDLSDDAVMTEGSAALAVTLTGTGSATLSESSVVGATTPISGSDSASLADSSVLAVTSSSSDPTALTDSSSLSVALVGVDTTALGEDSSVAGSSSPTAHDESSLSEVVTVAVVLSGSDSDSLADSGTFLTDVIGADSTTLSEAASVDAGSFAVGSDGDTLSEITVVTATLAALDEAMLTESAAVLPQLVSVSGVDSATLSEAAAILTDTGGGPVRNPGARIVIQDRDAAIVQPYAGTVRLRSPSRTVRLEP